MPTKKAAPATAAWKWRRCRGRNNGRRWTVGDSVRGGVMPDPAMQGPRAARGTLRRPPIRGFAATGDPLSRTAAPPMVAGTADVLAVMRLSPARPGRNCRRLQGFRPCVRISAEEPLRRRCARARRCGPLNSVRCARTLVLILKSPRYLRHSPRTLAALPPSDLQVSVPRPQPSGPKGAPAATPTRARRSPLRLFRLRAGGGPCDIPASARHRQHALRADCGLRAADRVTRQTMCARHRDEHRTRGSTVRPRGPAGGAVVIAEACRSLSDRGRGLANARAT